MIHHICTAIYAGHQPRPARLSVNDDACNALIFPRSSIDILTQRNPYRYKGFIHLLAIQ